VVSGTIVDMCILKSPFLALIHPLPFEGLFKHALTEADKICLSALGSYYDQGVYALASSYGGLAARLLLQPMEENARLLFSRQGALVEQTSCCQSAKGKDNEIIKSRTTCNIMDELEKTYTFLVRVVLYIGLLFAAIASNYSSFLLYVLAGQRWGSNLEASAALSAL
jgi:oligosaccharide translocation protein RFT1